MQKIVTNLWFNGRVQEALDLYKSLFKDFKLLGLSHYPESGHGTPGDIMTADFTLAGQEFIIINGGPGFPHSEAISLLIRCRDQKEIDHFWAGLSKGGETGQCGWLKDPFGISWQVVPEELEKLMQGTPEQVNRVVQAFMGMTKLDIAAMVAAGKKED